MEKKIEYLFCLFVEVKYFMFVGIIPFQVLNKNNNKLEKITLMILPKVNHYCSFSKPPSTVMKTVECFAKVI